MTVKEYRADLNTSSRNFGIGSRSKTDYSLSGNHCLAFTLPAVLTFCLADAGFAWAADPTPVRNSATQKEIFVPMRDGVHLSTDVTIPEGAGARVPAILVRTPYDKDRMEGPSMKPFFDDYLKQGYAVVLQNERGHFFSEGVYANYLEGASTDGYDTIEWITRQPWSNGKVGTIGCSSSSEQQWLMAASNPPGHAAMIPVAGGMAVGPIAGNETHGAMYRGGVPVLNIWAWWYPDIATEERLRLPPDSSQEQRIRLRSSFSLMPTPTIGYDATLETPNAEQLMHLPLQDVLRDAGGAISPLDRYLTWTTEDPRWRQVGQLGAGMLPKVPALIVDTWHNEFGVGEATRLFRYMQDQHVPNQFLIIGAGPHCAVMADEGRAELLRTAKSDGNPDMKLSEIAAVPNFADLKFGDLTLGDARYEGKDRGYAKLFSRWYAHWLKGEDNGVTDMPKVQLFVMNQGWISGDRWPLTGTRFTNYYLEADPVPRLHPGQGLLTPTLPRRSGDDGYVYDPNSPTPSLGGGCCGTPAALDQRPIEARKDVLSYSTAALDAPLTIAGPVSVVLYVSSSAKDTDFMVRLVDVYPDGKAINLGDDAFRTRYHAGLDKPSLLQPDEIYKLELTNIVTGIRFPKGHRVRIDVSSSSFPLFARNLNTGGNNFDETKSVIAENHIHRGAVYPSRVVLPVLQE